MKVIKLATALLIGCSAFNPLVAFSQLNIPQTSVYKNGNEYSCYAVERAGNYFEDGLNVLCDRAEYTRQTDYTKEHVERVERNSALTVVTYGGRYNCEQSEIAGNYFKKGIWTACNRAGYDRQDSYGISNDDIIDLRIELIKKTNEVRSSCIKLSEGEGSTNPDIINGCADVGIGVDATNLE